MLLWVLVSGNKITVLKDVQYRTTRLTCSGVPAVYTSSAWMRSLSGLCLEG